MIDRQNPVDYFRSKAFGLFFFLMLVVCAANYLLANVGFKFPGKIHFLLFPAAVISYFMHFDLICDDHLPHDPYRYYLAGRAKILLPLVWLNHLIQEWQPRITKQAWHKHRALLIFGPAELILCLAVSPLLKLSLGWPLVLACAFSIAAAFYSVSLFIVLYESISSRYNSWKWANRTL